MPNLMLSFAVLLHDSDLKDFQPHHGPLFHRWLPNGKDDAINLSIELPDSELQIWFEHCGFVDHKWNELIKFDYDRREVEPTVINKQAILDAGPLRGILIMRNIADETVSVLQSKQEGDSQYVQFGKQIVKQLYPRIRKFLAIARVNFGQYWIRELKPWDSRTDTLGHYCHSQLHLKYSLDEGATWNDFVPDQPVGYRTVTMFAPAQNTFSQYLSKSDWQRFAEIVNSEYEPSLAAITLARTHQFLDIGDIRQAFIEAVTALEIAVHEVFQQKFKGKEALLNLIGSFWNMPLQSQFVAIATNITGISIEDIEQTVQAIKTRNKIVHEGEGPTTQHLPELQTLLFSVARLIPGQVFKFPSANTSNNLAMSEDEWNNLPPGGKYYLRPLWTK